jgi:hypothetical protein
MDNEMFQQMEKRLNEQVEATRAMNETLNMFLSNLEAAKSVTLPPLDAPQPVTTALKVLQPSRVNLGVPSNFDGGRVQGHAFLTSCGLYMLLTASDFVYEQVHIHWALDYFKGRHMVSFTI